MEYIKTNKGNEYVWLYKEPHEQTIVLRDKWEKRIINARDEHKITCTPDELVPFLNQQGW